MQKTAEQIADAVIEKVAVSGDLAFKAFLGRGMLHGAPSMGSKALNKFFKATQKSAPRSFKKITQRFENDPEGLERIMKGFGIRS